MKQIIKKQKSTKMMFDEKPKANRKSENGRHGTVAIEVSEKFIAAR